MNPNLSPPGYSFKAAEKYHNNDKRSGNDKTNRKVQTHERVAWTSTRNLMTDDPTVATRIMIATALDAARLKQAAGVKNTGQKSAKHVQTLSLAWHPDEKVTRAEMEQAADEVIALLELTEHQITIYCHSDTDHRHIHLVANRVHPQTGRMAGLSNGKRKLDKWAHGYEQRRGRIVSPNRDEKYRRQEEAKLRHPDAKKRRAWAEQKRKAAAEKSPVTPKSERWDRLRAAEAKRAALRDARARAADLAAKVPLDRHEAAEWLLRPLMGYQETSGTSQKIAMAILAHDPDLNVQALLKEHLPALRNPADPREVLKLLDADHKAVMCIKDEIVDDPELDAAFDSLPGALRGVANELRETPWMKIERTLEKWVGSGVARTIRRAVDFLASLFRDEKIAKLEAPDEPPATGGSGQSSPPAPPEKRDPGDVYSP